MSFGVASRPLRTPTGGRRGRLINDPPPRCRLRALLGFPLRDSAAARTAGAARTSGCRLAGGATRVRLVRSRLVSSARVTTASSAPR